MRTLYLDAFSGISGDMFLGLALDLGVAQAELEAALEALPLSGWMLEVGRETRKGISGTRVQVQMERDQPHRHWRNIDAMLEEAPLHPQDRERARDMFACIARAEGKVHGVDPEKVHFHEVGAVDSIVDVVGAAVALRLLGVTELICAPLPLGRGTVQCAHGSFPLPAPATLEILSGSPMRGDTCEKELVTPTGAAIAKTLGTFAPLPSLKIEKTGYGIGGRDLDDRPNVLRGILGRRGSGTLLERDRVAVLETNIDDSPGEWLGALTESLLAEGALDVTLTSVIMKKGRPGQALTVLCDPSRAEALAESILCQSSALGVRIDHKERLKLRRRTETLELDGEAIRVKVALLGEEPLRVTPEYEDCAALAKKTGDPLPEIYRRVQQAAVPLMEKDF